MSGHLFNSHQRIPEISTKETKYEQISCKPFFFAWGKLGNGIICVQHEFQKFHHIWLNEVRKSQTRP